MLKTGSLIFSKVEIANGNKDKITCRLYGP